MSRVSFAFPAALLALAACHSKPQPTPAPTALEGAIAAASVTTPAQAATPSDAATPDPTPCGVGKLARYLNLLPTSTAKVEIAKVAGDRAIRYINVTESESVGPDPQRLNVETGADGRIKRFICG